MPRQCLYHLMLALMATAAFAQDFMDDGVSLVQRTVAAKNIKYAKPRAFEDDAKRIITDIKFHASKEIMNGDIKFHASKNIMAAKGVMSGLITAMKFNAMLRNKRPLQLSAGKASPTMAKDSDTVKCTTEERDRSTFHAATGTGNRTVTMPMGLTFHAATGTGNLTVTMPMGLLNAAADACTTVLGPLGVNYRAFDTCIQKLLDISPRCAKCPVKFLQDTAGTGRRHQGCTLKCALMVPKCAAKNTKNTTPECMSAAGVCTKCISPAVVEYMECVGIEKIRETKSLLNKFSASLMDGNLLEPGKL